MSAKICLEALTDAEQRIFLSAMSRELKICQKEVSFDDAVDLVAVCKSIERKVKNALWEPIPEHGRLGDLDALEEEMTNGINAGNYKDGYEQYPHINTLDDCVDCVRYADTVIEANKSEEKELIANNEPEIER